MRCHCLSGLPYDECCGRLHRGEVSAATAEQLMRSRFSAFAISDVNYLLRSWHPAARPDSLPLDESLRWYRLDITRVVAGGPLDARGEVAFTAYFRSPDGPGTLGERSLFERVDGDWYYLSAA